MREICGPCGLILVENLEPGAGEQWRAGERTRPPFSPGIKTLVFNPTCLQARLISYILIVD